VCDDGLRGVARRQLRGRSNRSVVDGRARRGVRDGYIRAGGHRSSRFNYPKGTDIDHRLVVDHSRANCYVFVDRASGDDYRDRVGG